MFGSEGRRKGNLWRSLSLESVCSCLYLFVAVARKGYSTASWLGTASSSCLQSPAHPLTKPRGLQCKGECGAPSYCPAPAWLPKKLKRHRVVYTRVPTTYATNVFRRKSISRADVCLLYATPPTSALCSTDLLGEVFCPEVKRLSWLLLHHLVYWQKSFTICNKWKRLCKQWDSCLSHLDYKHRQESI